MPGAAFLIRNSEQSLLFERVFEAFVHGKGGKASGKSGSGGSSGGVDRMTTVQPAAFEVLEPNFVLVYAALKGYLWASVFLPQIFINPTKANISMQQLRLQISKIVSQRTSPHPHVEFSLHQHPHPQQSNQQNQQNQPPNVQTITAPPENDADLIYTITDRKKRKKPIEYIEKQLKKRFDLSLPEKSIFQSTQQSDMNLDFWKIVEYDSSVIGSGYLGPGFGGSGAGGIEKRRSLTGPKLIFGVGMSEKQVSLVEVVIEDRKKKVVLSPLTWVLVMKKIREGGEEKLS
ncbi:hypothetical protein HK098_000629, partial [Nowakowskiella sp. JEL0407]